jgi:hypothetical protein
MKIDTPLICFNFPSHISCPTVTNGFAEPWQNIMLSQMLTNMCCLDLKTHRIINIPLPDFVNESRNKIKECLEAAALDAYVSTYTQMLVIREIRGVFDIDRVISNQ